MVEVTPEPSDERKFATNLGYGVTIIVAVVLLVAITALSTPDNVSSLAEIAPIIPPVLGAFAYILYRGIKDI
ncbi:hypothetical protein [Halohasta salina]|uniref:hypothetical protein n=1 Tax=Halohasta salina TaxID=2961621 RepID=UPI0020A4E31D|nr:hypothetical protein [Halohasta salina]